MADVKLSTIVGGGGGLTRVMPLSSVDYLLLGNKDALGVTVDKSDGAAFWSNLTGNDNTGSGFDNAVGTTPILTTETTIVDLTGQGGMLTHVISPRTQTINTTFTVRVTIDGVLHTFILNTVTTTARLVLGDFRRFDANAVEANGTGIGSNQDRGFNPSQSAYMTTPIATLIDTNIGMPYSESLKVTIQADKNPSAATNHENFCAVFLTQKPQEFSS